eukprot:209601-Pelagomonas_calceolata.AAC.4
MAHSHVCVAGCITATQPHPHLDTGIRYGVDVERQRAHPSPHHALLVVGKLQGLCVQGKTQSLHAGWSTCGAT